MKLEQEIFDGIFFEAKRLLTNLLNINPVELNDIPASPGVYLVYNGEGKVIYVGKAVNLRRRILTDHMGGDIRMSTSTLRRSINKVYGIKAGRSVKDWIINNCLFSYLVIEEHDLRDLVEISAIIYFRTGNKLLNFYRENHKVVKGR